MKRVPPSIFLALIFFAISGFAQTPPQPRATEELCKEFSFPASRFQVVLPGYPTETTQTIASSLGRIEQHAFTFEAGFATFKVAPVYPAEAKSAGITGKVEVQVTISKQGQVIEAIAISGPELLREAAEQADKQWIFKPAKADRRPVKVQGILAFNFALQYQAREANQEPACCRSK